MRPWQKLYMYTISLFFTLFYIVEKEVVLVGSAIVLALLVIAVILKRREGKKTYFDYILFDLLLYREKYSILLILVLLILVDLEVDYVFLQIFLRSILFMSAFMSLFQIVIARLWKTELILYCSNRVNEKAVLLSGLLYIPCIKFVASTRYFALGSILMVFPMFLSLYYSLRNYCVIMRRLVFTRILVIGLFLVLLYAIFSAIYVRVFSSSIYLLLMLSLIYGVFISIIIYVNRMITGWFD